MHSGEILKYRYVSKRKWREERSFNLYVRKGIYVLGYFQVGL